MMNSLAFQASSLGTDQGQGKMSWGSGVEEQELNTGSGTEHWTRRVSSGESLELATSPWPPPGCPGPHPAHWSEPNSGFKCELKKGTYLDFTA